MFRPLSLVAFVVAAACVMSILRAEERSPSKEPNPAPAKRSLIGAMGAAVEQAVSGPSADEKPKRSKRPRSAPAEHSPFRAGGAATEKASDDPFAKDEPKHKERKSTAKHLPLRTSETAIEDALNETTEIEFPEDLPLTDVIQHLKERHRIEIQLDLKALGDVGIGTDSPVTVNLRGISLRSALKLLLRPLNLTWRIADEVLLITTQEEAEAQLFTKVYDVSDLVVCRDKHGVLWDDYDELVDTITSCVRPTTWDQVGGPGAICGASIGKAKVLVVSQTYEDHKEIVKLLADIREVAKKNPDAELPRREQPRPGREHHVSPGIGGIGGGAPAPAQAPPQQPPQGSNPGSGPIQRPAPGQRGLGMGMF